MPLKERKSVWKGRALVLLASILWSMSGLFAKAPNFEGWPGPTLAFWRAVFASIFLLPFVRKPRWSPLLVSMSVCFAVMNYTLLTAFTHIEASCAIWLQYTAPIFVFVIGSLWLREKPTRGDWQVLGFGMTGVALILFFEFDSRSPMGVVMGVLSGACFAGVVLHLRRLKGFDAIFLVALNHLVTALLLGPIAAQHWVWPDVPQGWLLAGFGVLQMGLPYVLFANGVKSIPGHEASGITLLEPVLVPLWVYLAWSNHSNYQPPAWWTLAGGLFIALGLGLRVYADYSKQLGKAP